MAITFMSDGAGGTADVSTNFLSVYDGNLSGSVTVDTTVKEHGYASLKHDTVASASAYRGRAACLADAGRRVSLRMRFGGAGASAATGILRFITSGNLTVWEVRFDNLRKLRLYAGASGGTLVQTGATVLNTNQWYRISVAYAITSASVNEFRVWVDGVLELTASNVASQALGTANLRIGWTGTSPGANVLMWHQDCYVDDSTALTDPGDIRVTTKLPAGSGSSNAFDTPVGAGTNRWDRVNDRPASAATAYTQAGTSQVVENYTVQAASVGDDDLSASTVLGWAPYAQWSQVAAAGASAVALIANNVAIALTATAASGAYQTSMSVVASTSYPTANNVVGLRSTGTAVDCTLSHCGVFIAYTPALGAVLGGGTAAASGLALTATGVRAETATLASASATSAGLAVAASGATSAAIGGASATAAGTVATVIAGVPASYMRAVGALSYNSTNTATPTVTTTGTAAVGELVICYIGLNGTRVLNSVADTRGNTWSIVTGVAQGSTMIGYLAYSFVTTAIQVGDTLTFTFATSGPSYVIEVHAFGGVITQAPEATLAQQDSTTQTSHAGTLSAASSAGALVTGLDVVSSAPTTWGPQNGAIELAEVTTGGATNVRLMEVQYRIEPSAGVQPVGWDVTPARTSTLVAVAFKPQAAATAVNATATLTGGTGAGAGTGLTASGGATATVGSGAATGAGLVTTATAAAKATLSIGSAAGTGTTLTGSGGVGGTATVSAGSATSAGLALTAKANTLATLALATAAASGTVLTSTAGLGGTATLAIGAGLATGLAVTARANTTATLSLGTAAGAGTVLTSTGGAGGTAVLSGGTGAGAGLAVTAKATALATLSIGNATAAGNALAGAGAGGTAALTGGTATGTGLALTAKATALATVGIGTGTAAGLTLTASGGGAGSIVLSASLAAGSGPSATVRANAGAVVGTGTASSSGTVSTATGGVGSTVTLGVVVAAGSGTGLAAQAAATASLILASSQATGTAITGSATSGSTVTLTGATAASAGLLLTAKTPATATLTIGPATAAGLALSGTATAAGGVLLTSLSAAGGFSVLTATATARAIMTLGVAAGSGSVVTTGGAQAGQALLTTAAATAAGTLTTAHTTAGAVLGLGSALGQNAPLSAAGRVLAALLAGQALAAGRPLSITGAEIASIRLEWIGQGTRLDFTSTGAQADFAATGYRLAFKLVGIQVEFTATGYRLLARIAGAEMQTIKRTRGDDWRIQGQLRFIDDYGEPLTPQPALVLATSTFKSSIRDGIGGTVLWTSGPTDVTVIDEANRLIETRISHVATAALPPGNVPVDYVFDIEVTTAGGWRETATTLTIRALPDVTV